MIYAENSVQISLLKAVKEFTCDNDRVTSITYPNNIKEYYYYDKEGNILRYVTPNYKDFKFTYNPLSQRTSLTSPLLKSTLYSYNKNRDLTKITYPSSKEINYHYDNSQLSKVTTSNNDEFTYKYSFHNKIDTITRNSNEKTSYSYDGELMTKIRYEGELNQDISFTYNSDFLPNSITYLNGQIWAKINHYLTSKEKLVK